MRYVVVMAMLLLAMLTMTNTWAIESSSVEGSSTVVVVQSTDQALLGLEPGAGGGNAASTAYLSGGDLHLDFTRGVMPNTEYGYAASSSAASLNRLQYKGLFHVINNSDQTLCISVYVAPGSTADDLEAIYLRNWTDAPLAAGYQTAGAGGAPIPVGTEYACKAGVAPGARVLVDFWWATRSGSPSPGAYDFNVRVEGRRP